MNKYARVFFYIYLFSNVAQASTICVSFSGKTLLDCTMQGKKCKTEIAKFEDQIIEKIEEEQIVVAAQELKMKKLLEEVLPKRDQFELKHKNSKKNDPVFIKEKDELCRQINDLNSKQKELEKSQQLFMAHVEQATQAIKAKYDFATKLFYKNVGTRYGIQQGWDIVFEKNNDEQLLYGSAHFDKTKELLELLNKQVSAQGKIYQTKAEIQKLFDDLGILYLETIKIDSSIRFDIDCTKSAYYLANKVVLDRYATSYGLCIANNHCAPIYIKWISEKIGFGVFAASDIHAGDFIQEYKGVLRVPSKHKGLFADDTTYTWSYPPVANHQEILHVDGNFEGNEIRFINHSKYPNAVQITMPGYDNLFHVCYIAEKDIKAGEQILVSYGDAYWAARNYYEELSS